MLNKHTQFVSAAALEYTIYTMSKRFIASFRELLNFRVIRRRTTQELYVFAKRLCRVKQ